MLPLSLLNTSQGSPLLIELKSGESVSGIMVSCDTWMNVMLKDVVHTSADGETFKKIPEVYVRGTLIKYVRVPDQLLERIRDERQAKREERREQDRMERDRDFGYRNNNNNNRRRNYNSQSKN